MGDCGRRGREDGLGLEVIETPRRGQYSPVADTRQFRAISGRLPPWESLLAPELLRVPEELGRVDALLDDPAFCAPFTPYFHPVLGRSSTPIECYLRLMFLKFRYQLGYESLCALPGGAVVLHLRDVRAAPGRPAGPGGPCGWWYRSCQLMSARPGRLVLSAPAILIFALSRRIAQPAPGSAPSYTCRRS